MLHFAVTALLVFVFATILDLRAADATAISTDLYLPQFCTGCGPLIDYTVKTDLDCPISIETTTHDLVAYRYHNELDCGDLDDNLFAETATENVKFINAQLGSETSGLEISVEYRDEHQGNSGCTYFESKLRDPTRARAECGNVEPGSDYLEMAGVLTLTTVSVVSFSLLAGGWLLCRSFRNWQLRSMIMHGRAAARLQLHKGRRRSSGPIRG